ncbi:MAG: hydroxymethylglutaryl-CoA lyase [Dyella sp.]|uniref:hydroxymethylglutaryl-CoA lyase n=1 Tax=Dyella sp. TaxID=1869338 RepID=UPI003F7FFBCF
MTLPSKVKIVEVGPRDGLQNEKETISADAKVALVNRLTDAGFVNIEAASFVSPKWVPQMATSAEVMAGIRRKPGVIYSVLTPNMKGFEAALAAQADEVVIFGAASEAFSQKNINCSIAESIERFRDVAQAAKQHNIRLRGSISCSFGCPYQGEVPVADVVRVAQRLHAAGCYEVSLGDTIGVGTPAKARAMLRAVAAEVPMDALAVHFHDTYGQALANILACLEEGVRVVDSAVSGTGGCPYAKGATGNVASEDVVYMLHGMGMHTGVDLDLLVATGAWLAAQLHKETASRVTRARTAA